MNRDPQWISFTKQDFFLTVWNLLCIGAAIGILLVKVTR